MHHLTNDLGKRLHSIRTAQGLCLRALSGRAGVSSAMICMIENGKVNPSTGVLLALARGLGVTPLAILGDECSATSIAPQPLQQLNGSTALNDREPTFVRSAARRPLHQSGGVSWYNLTPQAQGEIMEISLEVESATARDSHPGVETCILMSGSVIIEVEDHKYALTVGDSLTFSSTSEHRLVNVGETVARILWLHAFDNRGAEYDAI